MNKELKNIPKNFIYQFQTKQEGASELIIVCSHKRDSFAFYKYAFIHNALFISDKRDTYFTLRVDSLVDGIYDFCKQEKIDNVCCIGCSKGGYGAMLISALLAKKDRNLKISFISFAPQTQLYPQSTNLTFPSYRALIETSKNDWAIRRCLEYFGDIRLHIYQPNLIGRIFYSKNCPKDNVEAERINFPNVRKFPLPYSFHATAIPFYVDCSNEELLTQVVNKTYPQKTKDDDLKTTTLESEKVASEIRSFNSVPSLNSLIWASFSENR